MFDVLLTAVRAIQVRPELVVGASASDLPDRVFEVCVDEVLEIVALEHMRIVINEPFTDGPERVIEGQSHKIRVSSESEPPV